MKILIDTNVIIDILLERKPFYIDSLNCIKKCINKGDRCYISASAITDIYYLTNKTLGRKETLSQIIKLLKIINIAEVNNECIYKSLLSKLTDFEDAVVEAVAQHIGAERIITRNINDFKNCKINVIEPREYINEN